MTTKWTLPTITEQYPEPGAEDAHIPWDDTRSFSSLQNLDGKFVKTAGELIHIARSPKLNYKNKTYFLKTAGFNFTNLPEQITGIEVRVTIQRYGRAVDDSVILCMGRQEISKNQANNIILPQKVYGGPTDLWDTKNLTTADLLNPNFGVVLRFQAHPYWPHKSPVLLDAVEIRIF